MGKQIRIELSDIEWPLDHIDHDREIVRAIVFDSDYRLYFVRLDRDDIFGRARLIETAGGGVEDGETLEAAIKRELAEELGAEVEIITKLGVVSDYYNLIHRHNINNYFLCRIKSLGTANMTDDEINYFHLSRVSLTPDEALEEYRRGTDERLGRLIANREIPMLELGLCEMEKLKRAEIQRLRDGQAAEPLLD